MTVNELILAIRLVDDTNDLYAVSVTPDSGNGVVNVVLTFYPEVPYREVLVCALYRDLEPLLPIYMRLKITCT